MGLSGLWHRGRFNGHFTVRATEIRGFNCINLTKVCTGCHSKKLGFFSVMQSKENLLLITATRTKNWFKRNVISLKLYFDQPLPQPFFGISCKASHEKSFREEAGGEGGAWVVKWHPKELLQRRLHFDESLCSLNCPCLFNVVTCVTYPTWLKIWSIEDQEKCLGHGIFCDRAFVTFPDRLIITMRVTESEKILVHKLFQSTRER